jgi:hypothetical protein
LLYKLVRDATRARFSVWFPSNDAVIHVAAKWLPTRWASRVGSLAIGAAALYFQSLGPQVVIPLTCIREVQAFRLFRVFPAGVRVKLKDGQSYDFVVYNQAAVLRAIHDTVRNRRGT